MENATYTPSVLGVFLAVQKKGSSLILVEGEQEKVLYEFVVQVVIPANKFQLYSSNSELFMQVMQKYAFDAYLFRKFGEKVQELTKEEYLEEFDLFTKNYNVLLGNQPVTFDYLIEDRLEIQEPTEEEASIEEGETENV